jgi:hypothetical protein
MFDFLLDGFSFRRTPAVLTVSELAALGPVHEPERNQISRLVRHFLERFFNHESASPDADSKTLLVQIACATALPGFLVALWLDPIYHRPTPPPYWLQVNHHLFFVLYSCVAMGIAMVFEWDLFFPDLLDVQILKTLPVKDRDVFLGRIAAIAVLVGGFLVDSNFLAPVIMHITLNPPSPGRFTAGHLLAVLLSGLFSAAFTLALQGTMLSLLGERMFRRVSLLLQGLLITLFVLLLLLFPAYSGLLPSLLRSGSFAALCFPPLWFLGIYQCAIEGAAAPPIFATLARIGFIATGAAIGLTMLTYPVAYLRRVRQVIEGPGKQNSGRHRTSPLARWGGGIFDRAVLRRPLCRAVYWFISQTLFRVQRYRIYLVLYCGVGLSVVVSTVFNLRVVRQEISWEILADGVRAAIAIAGLWTITGLRIALASSGNRSGSWVFHVLLGRPPEFSSAVELSRSTQVWVVIWSSIVTLSAIILLHAIAPPQVCTLPTTLAQLIAGIGFCVLLTDVLFLRFTRIAFAGERPRENSSVAFAVLAYFTLFPVFIAASVGLQLWIERSALHAGLAIGLLAAVHVGIQRFHRAILHDYSQCPALEDGEEEFPIKLSLRV